MKKALIAAALLLAVASARAQAPKMGQLINLSCMEALIAIDQANLAGVFSFIAEKDGPAAFGDLVVHDHKALKRFVAKLDADFKAVGGISPWDHEAVAFVQEIYASPLAETLEKPSAKLKSRLDELGRSPSLSLQEMSARRSKAR